MADLTNRLQQLSPERRKLFDLLKDQLRHALPLIAEPAESLRLDFTTEAGQAKENFRQFYDGVSRQLDSTMAGSYSFFLNYGYVADDSPEFAAVTLPENYINRNSVKLVLELIGDCDLENRRILDVGCGRGGTIYAIHQFFKPAATTGIDLSETAIQFCRKAHRFPGAVFRQGDAENLPLPDACFDVVTNVESSHGYPNIRSFYMEVFRVLAPGGYFLYTDLMPREKSAQSIGILQSLGFEIERDRDITRNVLLSCDQIAASRLQIFQGSNDQTLMANFLAAPGSQVYEEMNRGDWIYRMLKLRKAL
ncbi:MAG TPA: class I SAM-dependent methyltransferase [Bryobacteraceae bacterium]